MQENICGLLVQSTVAPTGTIGSMSSGIGVGTSQASQASKKALQESNLEERNTLLKTLDILFHAEEAREEKPLGLDLFPEALRDMLGLTRYGVASLVNKLLISPATIGSHISQLPMDITAAIEGLSHSVQDYHALLQTKPASTLNVQEELQQNKSGLSANCQALCHHFYGICDELNKNIAGKFAEDRAANKTHSFIAQATGSTVALGTLSTVGLMALMVDMIGSSLRELSGLVEFSKQESLAPKEKNMYQAFSECCKSFSSSNNSKETFLALHKLEKAILDFNIASEMQQNHSVSGPSFSVFTRLITAEPFVKTLISVNASSLGLQAATDAFDKEKSSENIRKSAPKASLIKDSSGGDAPNHSQNVTAFCEQFNDAIKHIDQQLEAEPDHELVAYSAKSTVGSNSVLTIAASLIQGFTGLILRELSGSVDFSKNDKGSKQESTAVLKTRTALSGDDLDKLMSRVCALQERLLRCQELGVSAPVILGASEAITFGSVTASLNMIAGMCSALREIHTLAASPSRATKLEDAEQLEAKDSAQSVIDSNKKTGLGTGTEGVSDNLSLHKQLQSIMEKVVLLQRSYWNPLNFGEDRHDINSAGKSSIGLSQGNSTGFLMGALGVIALTSLQSGIGLEALFGALRYSTHTKRVSEGVDRTELHNGSKTNLSFVSNVTRLQEEHFKSSSVIQTSSKATYLGSESIFSRSLTVALCHSGALTEILRRLIKEEQEQLKPVDEHLNSALVSDALMPKLYNNILKVLDDAELNHNPIPNLNNHMASSLGGLSNATIASALASQSVFISPILKSIAAAKKASIIGEGQKNEGVTANSEVSRIISTAMNVMQGFTFNSMKEINKFANPFHNSSVIHSFEEVNDTAMLVSCALSLLCEELFELSLSRSLALLDMNEVLHTTKQSSDQTKVESGLSLKAVKEDSGLGQESSLSHAVSAMRLTLSHLGAAFGELASNLNASPDLLKDNLEMHSSQQTLIKSIVPVLGELSVTMSALAAGFSNFPVSSAGSTDSLRKALHSMDHQLLLKPIHSSEHATKDSGSEISLLTGIVTDCVSSIMVSATKLLLQTSVLGLDTTLTVAKIMEILSIHPRPLQALNLETQALLQPNGLSNNTSNQTQNSAVLSTLGVASVVVASKTDQSNSTETMIKALQLAIDNRIDQVALLEDEEEASFLGLKAFYELLIRILHGSEQSENYKDIVLRFHRGGIALSNYHSAHGGIINPAPGKKTNPLISEYGFYKCDDAASLLETFINKAFQNERQNSPELLNKIKQELMSHKLSAKAEKSWAYIVNKVVDRLKTENLRISILHPGDSRRNQKKWEERRAELLNNEAPKLGEREELLANPSTI